ncbi:MAG: sugar phosphate isomerase/epimerase [Candidatus Caldatribacterium sp.]|uniref:sugar phosphate isomerase/epimerase family protein n=1 Tax=Candidatus Caldatribacterium sp. TaxID=2282143 RepID=UPI002991137A|nr:sugar phosphate isomerase/epimerase [Candidatus Caldatribacterium sp.]MCX7730352.1 sugar phosphate isomerase/epimerase [Candidatus Caldatribacterium sp.]MDW8080962.1 sugar phosphate isomerase/epimerase family protein [Candidatus Calescibacterium sp.]
MKKGINQWAFPANATFREIFELAKKHGFQGLELCPDEEGLLPLRPKKDVLHELSSLSQDTGIAIRSFATGLFWKYNLASPDASCREKAKDVVKALIDLAYELSVPSVLVIPGYVHVPWDPSSELVPYDDVLKRARESLQEVLPYAQSAGVVLALENVWNECFLSPLEFASFIDVFASPFIKAHFDTGNVVLFGYPEHWIAILGKRIATVHVKDFKKAVGTLAGFCLPLEGDVHWPEVMQALQSIPYNDYLIAEFIPPYRYSTEALLSNLSYNMDILIELAQGGGVKA